VVLADELHTISPAVYSGAMVVAVVTAPDVVIAVDPELLEQPIMVRHMTRKILRTRKIPTGFFIYYSYSAGY
jgi:hypothetical protein